MVDLERFIAGYCDADRAAIAFAPSGSDEGRVRDANGEFRARVVQHVMANPESACDLLVRDLFDGETAFAKSMWSVRHELVAFLASQLLARGGRENVAHYLACAWRGQDAYLSSLCVELTEEQRRAAVGSIDELLASTAAPPTYWTWVRERLAR